MTVIGITGPSGAGKSEISKLLCNKYGFSVIDADKVYHSLVSAPSECVRELSSSFGECILNADSSLDRNELKRLVLGEENREKLMLLNKISHKYVVKEIRDTISRLKEKNISCVIDAPLLIEAGLTSDCDFTLSVLADIPLRAERIMMRDGISRSDAMMRISSQKPHSFYIDNTDCVIYNNGDTESLSASLLKILSRRGVEL